MRGFPLLNGLILGVLVAAAVVPLVTLTWRATPAAYAAPAPDSVGAGRAASVTLRFAHRPGKVTLTHLDEALWSGEGGDLREVDFEVTLPAFEPAVGLDLVLAVQWPEDVPETAVELTLEPDSLEGRSGTVWGAGDLEEVLTFVWPEESS